MRLGQVRRAGAKVRIPERQLRVVEDRLAGQCERRAVVLPVISASGHDTVVEVKDSPSEEERNGDHDREIEDDAVTKEEPESALPDIGRPLYRRLNCLRGLRFRRLND